MEGNSVVLRSSTKHSRRYLAQVDKQREGVCDSEGMQESARRRRRMLRRQAKRREHGHFLVYQHPRALAFLALHALMPTKDSCEQHLIRVGGRMEFVNQVGEDNMKFRV